MGREGSLYLERAGGAKNNMIKTYTKLSEN